MASWLLLMCVVGSVVVDCIIVQTPQGSVEGKVEKVDDLTITKFLGVPYAQPPVGALRFRRPRPAANFTGTYDAKFGRAQCTQPRDYLPLLNLTADPDIRWLISEDCLYLNIYVPGRVDALRKLPVMVWIHGGIFLWGSGSHYDGRRLAGLGDVIVITINYRLGLLGFYPNGAEQSTLGLADQIEALRWVRRNIPAYGGDPSLVTIFGESAGGVSVSMLTSAPPAKGLFKRAISESGTASSGWVVSAARPERLKTIGKRLAALSLCSGDRLTCLQRLSTDQLIDLAQFTMSNLSLVGWVPDVDDYILLKEPLSNPGVEFIIGMNTNEGGTMIEYICTVVTGKPCDYGSGVRLEDLRKWVSPGLPTGAFNRAATRYQSWVLSPRSEGRIGLKAGSSFTTDRFERLPINGTASRLARAGHKIYVYEFNAVPQGDFVLLPWPVPWSNDSKHCDELPFVFGLTTAAGDRQLAMDMIRMWSNFAKGIPLAGWKEWSEEGNYLYITHGSNAMKRPLVSTRKEQFWMTVSAAGDARAHGFFWLLGFLVLMFN